MYHQCKTLCTLKDVRLLYATRLCIPDAIVVADQIVAGQKAHAKKRSKSLEQRANAIGRADALRSMANALGEWADEYLRKADAYGRRDEASVQRLENFDASILSFRQCFRKHRGLVT
ncbi:hypothetical protein Tco_1454718 [Tanacetum coccineum]